MPCPRCGSEWKIRLGSDGRKFYECSSVICSFNFHNQSKLIEGRYRRHFKLDRNDYIKVHEMWEDYSIGYIAKHFGIGFKQVKHILTLNLSDYAERIYGEPHLPIDLNNSSNQS